LKNGLKLIRKRCSKYSKSIRLSIRSTVRGVVSNCRLKARRGPDT